MKRWKTFEAVILGATIYMLAAMLHGAPVPPTPTPCAGCIHFTRPVNVSLNSLTAIYNQQFILVKTDFGFFWADTNTKATGFVQAYAKCPLGSQPGTWPPPASGLVATGDCNGTDGLRTSGALVEATNSTGNCGSATRGCGGVPTIAPIGFLFTLGPPFSYAGPAMTHIPVGTQTTDLQGRTWKIDISNDPNEVWVPSASGPTPVPTTPTATPTMGPATATPTRTATGAPTVIQTVTPTPGGVCVPYFTSDGQCHCLGSNLPCPVVVATHTPTASSGTPTHTPTLTPTPRPTATPTQTPIFVCVTVTPASKAIVVPFRESK